MELGDVVVSAEPMPAMGGGEVSLRDLLWRDEIAEEARRFRRRFLGELPEPQHSFLAAVLAEEARVARRKRALVAGGIGFLSLLVAGSLIALVIIRNAHKEAVRQTGIARSAETASSWSLQTTAGDAVAHRFPLHPNTSGRRRPGVASRTNRWTNAGSCVCRNLIATRRPSLVSRAR